MAERATHNRLVEGSNPSRPTPHRRLRRRALALLVLLVGAACDRAPTPTLVALPTRPAPVVIREAPTAIPTPTPPLPTTADLLTVADLLAHWGWGDPGPLEGVHTTTLSLAPDQHWQALSLSRAPAQTPSAGVEAAPALLLTGGGVGQAAFALHAGRDALIPYRMTWSGDGAAGVVAFAWQRDGYALDRTPLLQVDAQARPVGRAAFTLVSAPPPVPAPLGGAWAYLDASAAASQIRVRDAQGQSPRQRSGGAFRVRPLLA